MRSDLTRPPLLVPIVGAAMGVSLVLSGLALAGRHLALGGIVLLLFAAIAGGALMLGLRSLVARGVARLGLPAHVLTAYQERDAYTYLAFLVPLLGAFGVQPSIPVLYVIVLAFAAAQAALLYLLVRRSEATTRFFLSLEWVTFLFLISGMAALIYEIVWQRVLFASYGINVESVTIIVSLFMLGLGLGSLAGGVVSNRFPERLPQLFVLCEVMIGIFGLVSIPLLQWTAAHTLHRSMLGITLTIYALLCVPTMFMGATLPILVSYLHAHYRSIGRSVGRLYFFNTVGSALACFLTVDLLFVLLGQQAVVLLAACLNFTVGTLVYRYTRRLRQAHVEAAPPLGATPDSQAGGASAVQRIPFALVLVLSAVSGYLSLSQEILWVRAVSYGSRGLPQIFGHVLGCFLLGIAVGARAGERYCARRTASPLRYIAGALFAGALIYYFSVPIFSQAAVLHKAAGYLLSCAAVAVIAAVFGSILPVLSHFGIKPGAPVGMSLSWIYMANIMGSTAGPLVTGFLLLDRYGLQDNIMIVSLAAIAAAGVVALLPPSTPPEKARIFAAAGVGMAAVVGSHGLLYHYWRKFGPRRAGVRSGSMAYQMDDAATARLETYLADLGAGLRDKRKRASFALYALGLLTEGERKSAEPIASRLCGDETRIGATHDKLLHFLGQASWDDHAVRLVAARHAVAALSEREPVTAWIIDDTGFLKQGKHSVGVQRQYTGSAGKVTNCQVGVSLSVATRSAHLPIDFELYLPESWTDDPARCKKAKVPEDRKFQTKLDLALGMIERAVRNDIPGDIVLADCDYGKSPLFRETVRLHGLDYGVGVYSSTKVWRLDTLGRRMAEPVTAATLAEQLGASAFRRVSWREGTKGKMSARFCFRRVKLAQDDGLAPDDRDPAWLLMEWLDGETTPTKFLLTSLPRRMRHKQIVRLLHERWRTEQAYEEMKGELGLDHYEGRTFVGWHHHVSVVLCCYAFVVTERTRQFSPSARRSDPARPLAIAA